ncbi:DUF418 domain-containing protein [Pseudoalteromonas sp. S16_S37]|uniref:DUF418 domain-containing protein n=1 Tax=Pseudoalteromonas sp. S16_S37 TaxID=2720228 RepID=UPI0016806012|nr:DUF418 domain-containing protein [Pseudoalteromonas sp. S16_S37]MBD1583853.1 DUF418 domain-containing protein [Pseudoalteromonas sp. S16_S37]
MNRISQLDSLRGIAVLGLLLLNVYYLALFETGYVQPSVPVLSDTIIQYCNILALDSRFRSLFCMLFGAALVIQYNKHKDVDALKPRLITIAIFGALHSIFIWPGDILFSYGVAGFLALAYLQQSDNKVLTHGAAMFAVSCTLLLLLSFTSPNELINRQSSDFQEALLNAPTDFLGLLIHNISMSAVMLLMLPILTLWNALGLMLIGIYCFRNNIFTSGLSKPQLLLTLSALIILSILNILIEVATGSNYTGINESVVWANAFFGALLITHLNAKANVDHLLIRPIQAVGKMALTCYLIQSIVMIVYFVWMNPQARVTYNRVDYVEIALLGIGIQLLLAPLYLSYFKQGPFEQLLKQLSLKVARSRAL